jgi:hypothetical protein
VDEREVFKVAKKKKEKKTQGVYLSIYRGNTE